MRAYEAIRRILDSRNDAVKGFDGKRSFPGKIMSEIMNRFLVVLACKNLFAIKKPVRLNELMLFYGARGEI